MNILFIMTGEHRKLSSLNIDFEDRIPLYLSEVNNKPILQWLTESCCNIKDANYIYLFEESDIKRFNLVDTVTVLSNDAKIVSIKNSKTGDGCDSLLAIKHINNDEPLLILTADSSYNIDYSEVIEYFSKMSHDAGLISFDSIHPRYSFIRIDDDSNLITEVAEKRSISRNATTGFYYFKKGSDYINGIQNVIRKNVHIEGKFYISLSINELILNQLNTGYYKVELQDYIPLSTDEQIEDFKKKRAFDLPLETLTEKIFVIAKFFIASLIGLLLSFSIFKLLDNFIETNLLKYVISYGVATTVLYFFAVKYVFANRKLSVKKYIYVMSYYTISITFFLILAENLQAYLHLEYLPRLITLPFSFIINYFFTNKII